MSECSIKLRHEGKSYPRTCAKCKLGPCQDGQDYVGLTARIRELEAQLAEARADGWRRAVEAAAQKVERAGHSLHVEIRALPLPADLGVRHD